MKPKNERESDNDAIEVSDYEKLREANIKEKDALLESIGIYTSLSECKTEGGISMKLSSKDFECRDCSYRSSLYMLQRHVFEKGHNMKFDYEDEEMAQKRMGPFWWRRESDACDLAELTGWAEKLQVD